MTQNTRMTPQLEAEARTLSSHSTVDECRIALSAWLLDRGHGLPAMVRLRSLILDAVTAEQIATAAHSADVLRRVIMERRVDGRWRCYPVLCHSRPEETLAIVVHVLWRAVELAIAEEHECERWLIG